MILQTDTPQEGGQNTERCTVCSGDGVRRCSECDGIVVKKGHLMDGKIGTHFECCDCEEWYSDDECGNCDGVGKIGI